MGVLGTPADGPWQGSPDAGAGKEAPVPHYEYECTECGEELEKTRAVGDAAPTRCPACGGLLRQVFMVVGSVQERSTAATVRARAARSHRVKGLLN